jgi:NAD kinase
VLTLVGSNVLKPYGWRPVVLPMNSVIEMETVHTVRRPLQGYADGEPQGKLRRMTVRVSHIAAAELAFSSEHDPIAKLGTVQFFQEE